MRFQSFVRSVALVLAVTFFVSPVFMVPQRVQAQGGVPISTLLDAPTLVDYAKDAYGVIQEVLTQVNTYTSMVANLADIANTYVLQPLAFVMSGQLMKALTSSVIQFVIGKANGTGIPQFVVDVQQSLRSISDFQNRAYLRQVDLTNSPFATSIAQALGIDYNQKTSLAGFWAANMNTLGQNIPTYQPGYLSGNWSQGGTAAWFQLTTQTQNNPYMLYQSAQAKRDSLIGPGVGGSSGARLAQLQWGQGFMSWCATEQTGTKGNNPSAYTANTVTTGNNPSAFTANATGINPGDPCTDANGIPGKTQTPGSVIQATLNKVLGGQQDKLVQMGNISGQVNSILGNIGKILNTVNLAANILGGGSGGLFNAGQSSGALTNIDTPVTVSDARRSAITTGYGTSEDQIQESFNQSDVAAAKNTDRDSAVSGIPRTYEGLDGLPGNSTGDSGMPGRVQKYQTAWNAIASVASTTASSLRVMMDTCHAYWNASSKYENDAQNVLSFQVVPVLTQAAGVKAIADAALAQDALVKSQATTTSTYSADLQKLNTMTPTASDVAKAQYDATAYGGAKANPEGSLTVSSGSIVDQMNLIRNNAATIQSQYCTAQDYGGAGGD